MSYDLVDTLRSSVGATVKGALLFLSAVWVGAGISFFCIAVSEGIIHKEFPDLRYVWAAPFVLFSAWQVFNIFLLPGALAYFMRSDGPQIFAWCLFVGMESLLTILGEATHGRWPFLTISWFLWLCCISSLIFSGHLLQLWQSQRWREHFTGIAIENERRRSNPPTRPTVKVPLNSPHEAPPRLSRGPRG